MLNLNGLDPKMIRQSSSNQFTNNKMADNIITGEGVKKEAVAVDAVVDGQETTEEKVDAATDADATRNDEELE